jgi:hypothetical protein
MNEFQTGDIDMGIERWKPIPGFEGMYEISNLGRVKSLPRRYVYRERILTAREDTGGYFSVVLYRGDGTNVNALLHRLVCRAFNGEPPQDKTDVNHQDGVKANNTAANLEWTNDPLNVTHAFRVLGVKHAIIKPWLGKFGADNPHSKPVVQIASDGTRKYFAGVSDAARITGLGFRHISACCLGKRKRHGGFQWRFEGIDMKKSPIRQGDVLLIPIDKIPCDAVAQESKNEVILAYGEVTGHKHRFEFLDQTQSIKLYVAHGGARYLDVSVPADLLHEEHSTARVPAGKWLIPQQVEYTPKELVRVAD